MGTLFQDVRYCLRTLRKSPGFAAVVILTLALGIGANTAIFSIVDDVLLRPLPFREAGQLVRIVDDARGLGLHDIGMSVPEFDDLSTRAGVFDQISVTWPVDANLTGADHPERIELLAVSPNYFSLLGAAPQLGRVFGPEDQAEGFADSALISDGLWRRTFGADPKILGKRIRVDNDLYTIVGVMPPGFRHPGRTVATEVEMWGTAGFRGDPFPHPPLRSRRGLPGAIGRLPAGVTVEQAQAKLNAFTDSLTREFPNDYLPQAQWTVHLEPLQDAVVGNVRPLLLVLLGAVALMLLTGCVNIANLLLARASGRNREVAIRQALGAARGRLIRQLLTESVILSLAAGFVGILAARAFLDLLINFIPSKIPRLNEVGVDVRILLFALGISILTGILFGLAPAIQASAVSLGENLKESSRGSGGSRRQNRISSLLIVSEFAICMVLMTGAGLLVRTFWTLTALNPGFNPQNVLVARIWLPQPNDPKADPYAKPEDRNIFVREVLRRARALPGVAVAAVSTSVPLGHDTNPGPVTIENRPTASGEASLAEGMSITPDYFKVLGTPLIEGRMFEETDQAAGPLVTLIDKTMAGRFWPNESALGKRLKFGPPQSRNPWMTVVGVVGDIRHNGLDVDRTPHMYLPFYQRPIKVMAVFVRSPSDPSSLAEPLRREIQAVDPNLPVFGVRTLSEMVTTSLAQHRFSAQLMALFAALAMLLAAIGIYGVLAYSIGQRTREIGIRMALGARRTEVIRMVLWQGARVILAGVVIGLISALAFSQLLSQLVYGISLRDPIVFGIVPLILIAVAMLASYLPARRATRIDPMIALRSE